MLLRTSRETEGAVRADGGTLASFDIQKVSDKCVPCSTLKPGQVESVILSGYWLPVPKPSATWINHGPQRTRDVGMGGEGGMEQEDVLEEKGLKKGIEKDEEKDAVTGGSRCQSRSKLSWWRLARATTPGHYFLAESKVNGSRQGCVCVCIYVLVRAPNEKAPSECWQGGAKLMKRGSEWVTPRVQGCQPG